jgi:hypothetical protein
MRKSGFSHQNPEGFGSRAVAREISIFNVPRHRDQQHPCRLGFARRATGSSLFLTGVRARTLPVRVWNREHQEVQPVIARVSALPIGMGGLVLLLAVLLRGRRAATMRQQR